MVAEIDSIDEQAKILAMLVKAFIYDFFKECETQGACKRTILRTCHAQPISFFANTDHFAVSLEQATTTVKNIALAVAKFHSKGNKKTSDNPSFEFHA